GPVYEESTPDDVFFRDRTPITAVVTVVAVVAHREIAVRWHDEGSRGRAEKGLPGGITLVGVPRRHNPGNTEIARQIAIDVKLRGINAKFVARRPRKALDVERRAGVRIFPDAENVVGAENKNVAA